MKWTCLKTVIFHVNLCTSFMFYSEGIRWISPIGFELVSIPLCVITYPMNFSEFTQNEHLEGLNFMMYFSELKMFGASGFIWSTTSNNFYDHSGRKKSIYEELSDAIKYHTGTHVFKNMEEPHGRSEKNDIKPVWQTLSQGSSEKTKHWLVNQKPT